MIEDLKGGTIDALVAQDPFRIGYQAVATLVDKLNGKTPPKRIDLSARVITKVRPRQARDQRTAESRREEISELTEGFLRSRTVHSPVSGLRSPNETLARLESSAYDRFRKDDLILRIDCEAL